MESLQATPTKKGANSGVACLKIAKRADSGRVRLPESARLYVSLVVIEMKEKVGSIYIDLEIIIKSDSIINNSIKLMTFAHPHSTFK